MSVFLLDVNVLISLLDSAHFHHNATKTWFRAAAVTDGWATSPVTENGFIRVVSHVSYPNMRITPAMAATSLFRLKSGFSNVHRFWPDAISLTDAGLFDLGVLTGSKQTTDTYLAGLACHNGGRLATLDSNIAWRAVRGAASGLVHRIVS